MPMQKNEIESWVYQIIDRVQSAQPVEDVRVELKSEWPDDAHRVARRIAGHANAAHGEPILWLIGIDEKGRHIAGANYLELADWWAKVQALFDELPPDMTHLNVPYDNKTIAALLFNTERRPFVVKVPRGGHIDLEVPWRDGTRIRSARRRELITILSATCKNPSIDVQKGTLHISQLRGHRFLGHHGLELDVYIVPHGNERVVIPFHHCEGPLRFAGSGTPFEFRTVSFDYTKHKRSASITCSATEVVIDGPGPVTIRAEPPDLATVGRLACGPTTQAELKLWPTGSEMPVSVIAHFDSEPGPSDTTKRFSMQRPL